MKLSELHSGELLYWRGSGYMAALVRWWTRPKFWSVTGSSPYAHVGIFWRNGNIPYVIEADSKYGVVARPLTYDYPNAVQKTEVAWTIPVQQQILALIGKPYSFWTDVATVFWIAGKGSKSYMCSELAVKVLTIAGWDWKGYQPTPAGVLLSIKNVTNVDVEPLELV